MASLTTLSRTPLILITAVVAQCDISHPGALHQPGVNKLPLPPLWPQLNPTKKCCPAQLPGNTAKRSSSAVLTYRQQIFLTTPALVPHRSEGRTAASAERGQSWLGGLWGCPPISAAWALPPPCPPSQGLWGSKNIQKQLSEVRHSNANRSTQMPSSREGE